MFKHFGFIVILVQLYSLRSISAGHETLFLDVQKIFGDFYNRYLQDGVFMIKTGRLNHKNVPYLTAFANTRFNLWLLSAAGIRLVLTGGAVLGRPEDILWA